RGAGRQDAGCEAGRVGALTVAIPPDVPEADAAFFVKAWRNRPPMARIRLLSREPVRDRVLERVPRRVGAPRDAELPVDVRQVVFDRVLAEPELVSDLPVGAAGGDALEDLGLAGAEARIGT